MGGRAHVRERVRMYARAVPLRARSSPRHKQRLWSKGLTYGTIRGDDGLKPIGSTGWRHLDNQQPSPAHRVPRGKALRSLDQWSGSRQRYAMCRSRHNHPDKLRSVL
jgi:hypothetical protein